MKYIKITSQTNSNSEGEMQKPQAKYMRQTAIQGQMQQPGRNSFNDIRLKIADNAQIKAYFEKAKNNIKADIVINETSGSKVVIASELQKKAIDEMRTGLMLGLMSKHFPNNSEALFNLPESEFNAKLAAVEKEIEDFIKADATEKATILSNYKTHTSAEVKGFVINSSNIYIGSDNNFTNINQQVIAAMVAIPRTEVLDLTNNFNLSEVKTFAYSATALNKAETITYIEPGKVAANVTPMVNNAPITPAPSTDFKTADATQATLALSVIETEIRNLPAIKELFKQFEKNIPNEVTARQGNTDTKITLSSIQKEAIAENFKFKVIASVMENSLLKEGAIVKGIPEVYFNQYLKYIEDDIEQLLGSKGDIRSENLFEEFSKDLVIKLQGGVEIKASEFNSAFASLDISKITLLIQQVNLSTVKDFVYSEYVKAAPTIAYTQPAANQPAANQPAANQPAVNQPAANQPAVNNQPKTLTPEENKTIIYDALVNSVEFKAMLQRGQSLASSVGADPNDAKKQFAGFMYKAVEKNYEPSKSVADNLTKLESEFKRFEAGNNAQQKTFLTDYGYSEQEAQNFGSKWNQGNTFSSGFFNKTLREMRVADDVTYATTNEVAIKNNTKNINALPSYTEYQSFKGNSGTYGTPNVNNPTKGVVVPDPKSTPDAHKTTELQNEVVSSTDEKVTVSRQTIIDAFKTDPDLKAGIEEIARIRSSGTQGPEQLLYDNLVAQTKASTGKTTVTGDDVVAYVAESVVKSRFPSDPINEGKRAIAGKIIEMNEAFDSLADPAPASGQIENRIISYQRIGLTNDQAKAVVASIDNFNTTNAGSQLSFTLASLDDVGLTLPEIQGKDTKGDFGWLPSFMNTDGTTNTSGADNKDKYPFFAQFGELGQIFAAIMDAIQNWFGDATNAANVATNSIAPQIKTEAETALNAANIPVADQAAAIKKSATDFVQENADKLAAKFTENAAEKMKQELLDAVASLASASEFDGKKATILQKYSKPQDPDVSGMQVPLKDKDGNGLTKDGKKYNKDGKILDVSGAVTNDVVKDADKAMVTLPQGSIIELSKLPDQGAALQAAYNTQKPKMDDYAKKDFTQLQVEAQHEQLRNGSKKIWDAKPGDASFPKGVEEKDGMKYAPIEGMRAGKKEVIGYVSLKTADVFEATTDGKVGAKVDFAGLKNGSHPYASEFGSKSAAYLVSHRDEFVNSMVYDKDHNKQTPAEKVVGGEQGYFKQVAKAGKINHTTIGMAQSYLNNVVNILEQAQKQTPPIDISQIKLSKELEDVLTHPGDNSYAEKLWRKFNNEKENAFFEDPRWASTVNVLENNMKAGEMEIEGRRAYGYVNKDGLQFTEHQFNSLRAIADNPMAPEKYNEFVKEQKDQNTDLFRNATVGDVANAIRKADSGETLEGAEAALYARAYLSVQSHAKNRLNPTQVGAVLLQMANRIDEEGANRTKIFRGDNNEKDREDIRVLSDLNEQIEIRGGSINKTNVTTLRTPDALKTGSNLYSKDVETAQYGSANDFDARRAFRRMSAEERAEIVKTVVNSKIKAEAGEFFTDLVIDIFEDAGKQGAKKLPKDVEIGGIKISVNDNVEKINSKVAKLGDKAAFFNDATLLDAIRYKLTDNFDEMALGAKVRTDKGEEKMSKGMANKSIEDRAGKGGNRSSDDDVYDVGGSGDNNQYKKEDKATMKQQEAEEKAAVKITEATLKFKEEAASKNISNIEATNKSMAEILAKAGEVSKELENGGKARKTEVDADIVAFQSAVRGFMKLTDEKGVTLEEGKLRELVRNLEAKVTDQVNAVKDGFVR